MVLLQEIRDVIKKLEASKWIEDELGFGGGFWDNCWVILRIIQEFLKEKRFLDSFKILQKSLLELNLFYSKVIGLFAQSTPDKYAFAKIVHMELNSNFCINNF